LLGVKSERPSALAEAFLFAADRAQHVERKMRPAAESGSFVLSDRYYYSTIAFQGYGRGLDLETMWKINHLAIQGFYPDITLLLELDPAEGLKRAAARNKQTAEKDGYEQEALDFHKRLRDGFLEIAKKAEEPFMIVDASAPADQVFASVQALIERWFESAKP
jgi:dTMP kinase